MVLHHYGRNHERLLGRCQIKVATSCGAKNHSNSRVGLGTSRDARNTNDHSEASLIGRNTSREASDNL